MHYPIIESRDCTAKVAWMTLKQEKEKAESDWNRPVYHYCPISNWMNDPNGGIYYDGWYHLFYLQDPFSADGFSAAVMPDGTLLAGNEKPNRFWAHIRSRDLVKWEELPFALVPDRENDEIKPISGSVIKRQDGTFAMFFTSVRYKKKQYEQCMATSQDGLLTWKRWKNTIVQPPQNINIEDDWRDPYLFYYKESCYMIIAAATQNEALLLLYCAENQELTKWKYIGIMLSKPRSEIYYFECPRILVMENKVALIFSPFGNVRYYLGKFDAEIGHFIIEKEGVVDYNSVAYASQPIQVEEDKYILLSWAPGWFSPNLILFQNWNGCLCTPREIRVSEKGDLSQLPVTGQALEKIECFDMTLNSQEYTFLPEFKLQWKREKNCINQNIIFEFFADEDEKLLQRIQILDKCVIVGERTLPCKKEIREISCICDHFLWEYYFQEGEVCYTDCIPKTPQTVRMKVRVEGNKNQTGSLEIYSLQK